MGWSAVWDCGICWSYSLPFCLMNGIQYGCHLSANALVNTFKLPHLLPNFLPISFMDYFHQTLTQAHTGVLPGMVTKMSATYQFALADRAKPSSKTYIHCI